jgi:large subunit ribosomal protein L31
MKKDIHPELFDVMVACTCGYSFETTSTEPSIRTTLCSNCHPFYTGAQKYVDTAGRIEKFEKKFGKKSKK